MIFAAGTAAAVLLSVVMHRSVLVTAVLMAVLVGCMHGVNLVLIGIVPRQFRRFGRVGLVSGLLNSCTYVGSAVSTYGVALLSESLGWQKTSLLWAVIALGGAVVCLLIAPKWKAFRKDDVN